MLISYCVFLQVYTLSISRCQVATFKVYSCAHFYYFLMCLLTLLQIQVLFTRLAIQIPEIAWYEIEIFNLFPLLKLANICMHLLTFPWFPFLNIWLNWLVFFHQIGASSLVKFHFLISINPSIWIRHRCFTPISFLNMCSPFDEIYDLEGVDVESF